MRIKLLIILLFCLALINQVSAETNISDTRIDTFVLNATNLSLFGNMTTNFNTIGNITLGQKLIFAFNEMIDNIINGWLTFTGNVNITDNLIVAGNTNLTNLTVKGNLTAYNLNATGDIQGTFILGDGSLLRNLLIYNQTYELAFNATYLLNYNATYELNFNATYNNVLNSGTLCSGNNKLVGFTTLGVPVCMTDNNTGTAGLDKNATGYYLYNNTNTIFFNGTALNITIEQLDTDTTYTAGSNLSLVGTVFHLNTTTLKTWLDTLYQAITSAIFDKNTTGFYLYNNTNTIFLNDTRLNITIKQLDTNDSVLVNVHEGFITNANNTYQLKGIAYNVSYELAYNKTYEPAGANVSTITCSGTDKISAINNVTGVVTCSTDTGGASLDLSNYALTNESEVFNQNLNVTGNFTVRGNTTLHNINATGNIESKGFFLGDISKAINYLFSKLDFTGTTGFSDLRDDVSEFFYRTWNANFGSSITPSTANATVTFKGTGGIDITAFANTIEINMSNSTNVLINFTTGAVINRLNVTTNITVPTLLNCASINTTAQGVFQCSFEDTSSIGQDNTNIAFLNNTQAFTGQNNFSNVTIKGNLTAYNLNATGNIQGTFLLGDGSLLRNLPIYNQTYESIFNITYDDFIKVINNSYFRFNVLNTADLNVFGYGNFSSGINISRGNLIINNGRISIGNTIPNYTFEVLDTGTITAVNLSGVLYIDANNERVSIGTGNPTVVASRDPTFAVEKNSTDQITWSINNPGVSANSAVGLQFAQGSTELGLIQAANTGSGEANKPFKFYNIQAGGFLEFLTKTAGGVFNDALYIASTGNVGIGTTTPGLSLDVIGSVNISKDINVSSQRITNNLTINSLLNCQAVNTSSTGMLQCSFTGSGTSDGSFNQTYENFINSLNNSYVRLTINEQVSGIKNFTNGIVSKYVNVTNNLTFYGLANCQTLNTSADGTVQCSIDDNTGADGSFNLTYEGFITNANNTYQLKGIAYNKTYEPVGANVSTITCSGTDKVSAINNVTGVVTCSADTGGASLDLSNYALKNQSNYFPTIQNFSNIWIGNGSRINFTSNYSNRFFLTSNNDTAFSVCASGCNFQKIQDAVDNVPFILRHTYTIIVGTGAYDEHVYIPPTMVARSRGDNEGSVAGLRIRGNCTDINLVRVQSFQISANVGANNPYIQCMEIYGVDTDSDENASISVYGSSQTIIGNLNITGASKYAIMAYSSSIDVANVTFNNQDYGFLLKRQSFADMGDSISGSGLGGNLYLALVYNQDGYGMIANNVLPTISSGDLVECDPNKGAIVLKGETIYCIERFNDIISNLSTKNLTVDSSNGVKGITILRNGNIIESGGIYVDDNSLVFNSSQDEATAGFFTFIGGNQALVQVVKNSNSAGANASFGLRIISPSNSGANHAEILARRTNSPNSQDTELYLRNQKAGVLSDTIKIDTTGMTTFFGNINGTNYNLNISSIQAWDNITIKSLGNCTYVNTTNGMIGCAFAPAGGSGSQDNTNIAFVNNTNNFTRPQIFSSFNMTNNSLQPNFWNGNYNITGTINLVGDFLVNLAKSTGYLFSRLDFTGTTGFSDLIDSSDNATYEGFITNANNTYQLKGIAYNLSYESTYNKTYEPVGANVSTITCSGTDKISAINNVTGVVTCSADTGGASLDLSNYALTNQSNSFQRTQNFSESNVYVRNQTIDDIIEATDFWDEESRKLAGLVINLKNFKDRQGFLANTFIRGVHVNLTNYGDDLKPFGYSVLLRQGSQNYTKADASGFVSDLKNINKSWSNLKGYNAAIEDDGSQASLGLFGFFLDMTINNDSTQRAVGLQINSAGPYSMGDGLRLEGGGGFDRGLYIEMDTNGTPILIDNNGANYSMILDAVKDFRVNASGQTCIGCNDNQIPAGMLHVRGAESRIVFTRNADENQNISITVDGNNNRIQAGLVKDFIIENLGPKNDIFFRIGGTDIIKLDNNSRLGILTTNPTVQLEVFGNINASAHNLNITSIQSPLSFIQNVISTVGNFLFKVSETIRMEVNSSGVSVFGNHTIFGGNFTIESLKNCQATNTSAQGTLQCSFAGSGGTADGSANATYERFINQVNNTHARLNLTNSFQNITLSSALLLERANTSIIFNGTANSANITMNTSGCIIIMGKSGGGFTAC